MDLKEILDFITWENKRVKEKVIKDCSENEEILYRMSKVTEELGELANEVIANLGMHRKDKQKEFDKTNLPEEFADVILTTLLLGDTLNINIEKALKDKIEKVKKRKY